MTTNKTIIKSDMKSIWKYYGKKLFRNAFLIGFVLFLLNAFVGFSAYLHQTSNFISEKLGVYLYLDDGGLSDDAFYNRLLDLTKEFEDKNISVAFVSSDEAFDFLEKKLPGLTDNFQKFGIENPIAPTLYISFDTKKDYEYIQNTVNQNRNIILNYKDLERGTALGSQNNNVLSVMNFVHFVKIASYIIIMLLFLLVLAIVHYFLEVVFQHFHNDLHRKKLLGANEGQLIGGLLWISILLIIASIVIGLILTLILNIALNIYTYDVFATNVFQYFMQGRFWIYVGLESLIILLFSIIFSYRYLHRLDKSL